MRLLQVTNTYYPERQFGGPPLKIHALSQGLAQRGHLVSVLTFSSGRPQANHRDVMDGVAVQYVPWMGYGLHQIPRQHRLVAEAVAAAEVVHCYGLYNLICPMVVRLARKAKRPVVLEPLGMYQPRARNVLLKRLYHRLFTRRMIRSAALVVATSPAERDELRCVVPDAKLVVRRNGIDLGPFQSLPSPEPFRRRFGLLPGERMVLFLGRISPVKNLEQLVSAFAHAKVPRVKLFLVGPLTEPDYAARLRRQIEELGLDEKVILTGPLFDQERLPAFAAADLFVMPSLIESYGNAVAEAVAAGLPVLLTETCGIAPAIHGRAGLAIPLGVDSLADGLRVMCDPSRRAPLIGRSSEVLGELSWVEPLRQMEAHYQSLLATAPDIPSRP